METYWEHMNRVCAPWRKHAAKTVRETGAAEALAAHFENAPYQSAVWEEAFKVATQKHHPHSLHEMMREPALVEMWDRIAKGLGRSHATSMFTEMWMRKLYDLHGDHTYEVSPGLSDQLDATELRGVTTDILRLPFPCIYITVPENASMYFPFEHAFGSDPQQFVNTKPTNWNRGRVEGIAIAERWENGSFDPDFHGELKPIAWSFMVVGTPDRQLDGMNNYMLYTFDVPMPMGTPLDRLLEVKAEWIEKLPNDFRAIYTKGVGMAAQWERFFRWAINVILYITNTADPSELREIWANKEAVSLKDRADRAQSQGKPHKAKELRAKLREMDVQRRIYVGMGHRRLSEVNEGPTEAKQVRTLVAGHYRNQACGTGWQDRRLKWIHPHWSPRWDNDQYSEDLPISEPRRIVTGGLGKAHLQHQGNPHMVGR